MRRGEGLKFRLLYGIGVDNDGLIYVSVNTGKGYYVKVFKYLIK